MTSKNMFDLETALSTWRHQYKYSRSFKGRDLDELEQNLRDQIRFLVEAGHSEEDAFREAVAEMGSFHETESEYRSVVWMKTRDRREVGQEIRHQVTMMANYVKVASRNLRKNKLPSLINIAGLSLAIAVSVVSYLYVIPIFTKDHFHQHAEDIYLVHEVTQEDHGEQWWGFSPRAMGPLLADESSLVERVVRFENTSANIKKGDREFQKWLVIADEGYFTMFDINIVSGSTELFGKEPGVILAKNEALFLFGDVDPVGQTVDLTLPDGQNLLLPVLAVAEDQRIDSSLIYDYVMPFSLLPGQESGDWGRRVDATFVQRNPEVTEAALRADLNRYLDQANAARDEAAEEKLITRFEIDNLKSLSWNRSSVRDSVATWIPWNAVFILVSLAVLLLLLACFNYMNISMAMVTRRVREIGVRKAVGGQRGQLILQFLTENLLVSVASLVIGLTLASALLLPIFSQVAGGSLSLGITDSLRIWVFMAGIILTIGCLSGAYPAIYISSFRPIAIFQKRVTTGRRRPVTHTFLALQFVLAFLTVTAAITLVLNGKYLAEKDWGFEADQRILYRTQDAAEFDILSAALEGQAGVSQVVSSEHAIGFSSGAVFVTRPDSSAQRVVARRFSAGAGYADFLGIEQASGRSLADPQAEFGPESIVVNQAFAEAFDMDFPVGEVVVMDSLARTIVGVTENFHFNNFYAPVDPAFLEVTPAQDHVYVNALIMPGSMTAVQEAVKAAYREHFPDREVSMTYQDQVFKTFQKENTAATAIFTFVAILALFISCLSIFALSTQNILNKRKEIGVRKVLGGDSLRIAHLVNRRYVIILTIGSLVAAPLAWFAMELMLSELYAYSMDLNVLPFVLAYLVIVGVALATITMQARAIRRTAPAEVLRVE